MFAALVVAGALGRAAAVVLTATMPPATFDGLGATAAGELASWTMWISVLVAGAIGAVAVGWWIVPLLGAAGLGTLVMAALADSKIGGIGGDVLGATEVVSECLVLIVATGLASHASLWWG